MSYFEKMLKFGKIYEQKSLKYFEYDKVEFKQGKFSYYDYILYKDDKEYKIEVKSDKLAHKSGNLCIEIKSNNILSGLSITKADYWIYFIVIDENNEICYKIPVEELKKLVFSENYRKIYCGYKKLSYCCLLPYKNLDKYIISPQKIKREE